MNAELIASVEVALIACRPSPTMEWGPSRLPDLPGTSWRVRDTARAMSRRRR